MEQTTYKAILQQLKEKEKTLFTTLIVLIIIGGIIVLIRSCQSSDPLVDDTQEISHVKAGSDMEQLIFRIQNCSRLYTTEYQVHKIITHEDQKQLNLAGMKLDIPFTDRRIAIPMDATLKAYVDLGAFSEQNIRTNGERIQVVLPDPHVEVTSTMVDHDKTLSHVSVIRNNYTAKEQEILHQQGLKSITENILNSDILENARISAARTLIPILTKMGYKEENIKISFSKESFDTADLTRLMDNNMIKLESKKE